MNLYDLIVLALATLGAHRGYHVGLLGRLLGWLAVALGLLLASRYADAASEWFVRGYNMSSLPAHLLAYVVLIAGAGAVVLLLARLLKRVVGGLPVAGRANRVCGALAGTFVALVCVALLTGVLLRPPLARTSFATIARHSQTAQIVRSLEPSWEPPLKGYALRPGVASDQTVSEGASSVGRMREPLRICSVAVSATGGEVGRVVAGDAAAQGEAVLTLRISGSSGPPRREVIVPQPEWANSSSWISWRTRAVGPPSAASRDRLAALGRAAMRAFGIAPAAAQERSETLASRLRCSPPESVGILEAALLCAAESGR